MSHVLDRIIRLVGALCIVGVLAPGCSLPLVMESGNHEFDWAGLPTGTEITSCTTPDGIELRGIYVEAATDAPLVLHLLPRGASATSGIPRFAGFREALGALRRAGFSSLVLDYRGVGASGGEVDASALPTDARAMWAEALARRDGRADEIVLRGASLGSLAAASILEGGGRPRAVVLAAPIDSETIAGNAAGERLGAFLAFFASPFVSAPDIRGLGPTLEDARTPVLVLLPTHDPLLLREQREPLIDRASPTVRFEALAMDHEDLVLRFYGFESSPTSGRVVDSLTVEEAEFLWGLQ